MGTSRKGIPHVVTRQKKKVCPNCGKVLKSLGLASHRAVCKVNKISSNLSVIRCKNCDKEIPKEIPKGLFCCYDCEAKYINKNS